MADVSQLEVNGTTYNICDATARDSLSHVLESVYPVGATYISTDSTNPTTLFGFGTWTRIEGQFLLGATDEATGSGASYVAGATGGTATVTLTSAQSGLPAHNHETTITQPAFNTPSLSHTITQPAFKTPSLSHSVTQATYNALGTHSHTITKNITNASGGSVGVADSSSRNFLQETSTTSAVSAGTPSQKTGVSVTAHAAAACTRSTDVAISNHAAAACTRSTNVAVTVSNNTATDATAAHNNMPPFLAVYIWYRSA